MPPAIKKALESIGLGDKEVRVLLVLIEKGPMFAAGIAKVAKLNRTTTYGILKELAAKGLVSSSKDASTKYQSIAPELLPAYIERRGNELLEVQKQVAEAVPQITLLRSKGKTLPRVQFFEGKEGVEQAYEDTLENNQGKKLYEITGIDDVYTKLDPKFVDYYLKKRTTMKIHSSYIAPESAIGRRAKEEDAKLLRKASFIPEQYKMNTEIAIYDNKVGIFSYAQENPVAILIEDETIAHTMKTLFDYIESTTK
ncbi:hypothetical protein HYT05_00645 [Candidatus Kaiserbacteria bacterium]|nr:hypothetical protein [Candidatus Kaiserbacteria bacterium]